MLKYQVAYTEMVNTSHRKKTLWKTLWNTIFSNYELMTTYKKVIVGLEGCSEWMLRINTALEEDLTVQMHTHAQTHN